MLQGEVFVTQKVVSRSQSSVLLQVKDEDSLSSNFSFRMNKVVLLPFNMPKALDENRLVLDTRLELLLEKGDAYSKCFVLILGLLPS